MGNKTYSRTSPTDGRRATLGANGRYSRKNNKGYIINQGIGNLDGNIDSVLSNENNSRSLNTTSTDYDI
tara:strand:- start:5686 stop:5892 length:207 start_codon:yes stop_codon:yes gene_type:complete